MKERRESSNSRGVIPFSLRELFSCCSSRNVRPKLQPVASDKQCEGNSGIFGARGHKHGHSFLSRAGEERDKRDREQSAIKYCTSQQAALQVGLKSQQEARRQDWAKGKKYWLMGECWFVESAGLRSRWKWKGWILSVFSYRNESLTQGFNSVSSGLEVFDLISFFSWSESVLVSLFRAEEKKTFIQVCLIQH